MNNYTIYCTEKQTRKALELGAKIDIQDYCPIGDLTDGWFVVGNKCYHAPTAEQMIGWLEQNTLFKCIQVSVDAKPTNWMYAIYYGKDSCIALDRFSSRKEATLASIDAALDYLIIKE